MHTSESDGTEMTRAPSHPAVGGDHAALFEPADDVRVPKALAEQQPGLSAVAARVVSV